MIIFQTGVGSPFTFVGAGDELVVSGVISNLGSPTTPVISSALAGNIVTNTGMIASFGGGSAIALALGGTIGNSGVISGAVTAGDRLDFTNEASGRFSGFLQILQGAESTGSVVTNRGTMVFTETAGNVTHLGNTVIHLAGSNDLMVNSGKITGDIHMGAGNDIYDGRQGAVLGTVFGGLGDDLYYLTQATVLSDSGGADTVNARMSATLAGGIETLVLSGFGNFSGTGNNLGNLITGNGGANLLDGLGGNDTMLGGNGADTVLGNTGNDSLQGQAGNDRIQGGYGNDTAEGGDGNDSLMGDTGADLLQGGLGADTLLGGVGGDSLSGGDDADVLIGGAYGTDWLTGGAGADRFAFVTLQDSFASLAADVVTDFVQGEDLIDLSALIGGEFLFQGGGAFSTAQASVRTVIQTGKTLVLIDSDHSGVADMQLFLTGEVVLSAADFLL